MHSRIIQISKEPIGEYAYIDESDYYDSWFLGSIADYVADCDDREDELEHWLKNTHGIKYDPDKETIVIENKKEYFKYKYKSFKETIEKLENITIDQFISNDIDMEVYYIRTLYEDQFGLYVDDTGEYYGLITFDSLIRNSNDGDTYHIGGIVDYHF